MPNFRAVRPPSASFRYRKCPGVVRSNNNFGRRLSHFKRGNLAPRDRPEDEEEGPQERDETDESDNETSVRSCPGLDCGNGSPPSSGGVDGLIFWSRLDTPTSNRVRGVPREALLYDIAENGEDESLPKNQEESRGREEEEGAGGREQDDAAVEVLHSSAKSSRLYHDDRSSCDDEVPILIFSDTYSDDLGPRQDSAVGEDPTALSYVSEMSATTVKAANTTHIPPAVKRQMTLGSALVKTIEDIDAEVKRVNEALRRVESRRRRAERRVRWGRTEPRKGAEGRRVRRDASPEAARCEAPSAAAKGGDAYDWRRAVEAFAGYVTNELGFRRDPNGKSAGEQPMGGMVFM